MHCPKCDSNKSKVYAVRELQIINARRRWRKCLSCGRKYRTVEKIEQGDDFKYPVVNQYKKVAKS